MKEGASSFKLTKILRVLGLLILVAILWRVDWSKLSGILQRIDLPMLVAAIVLNLAMILTKGLRWWVLMRSQGIPARAVDALKIYTSAQYFGMITPARVGEFLKIIWIKHYGLASKSVGLSSVLVDRLLDLQLLFILGFFGIWKLDLFGSFGWAFLAGSVGIVAVSLVALNREIAGKILDTLFKAMLFRKLKADADELFASFREAMLALIQPRLAIAAIMTLVIYAGFFLGCWCLAVSLGISVPYVDIAMFVAVATLVALIPVTVSGIGTREATLIYLFSIIGVGREEAVAFSLLLFVNFFLLLGSLGYVVWLFTPMKKPEADDLRLDKA